MGLKNRQFMFILSIMAGFIFLMSISFVYADSVDSHSHEEKFELAQEIIEKQTSCSELTGEDLEALGEYFMEQMHPGEAHILMDQRMGGEGSESLRNMHVGMGARFYCDSKDIPNTNIKSGYGIMGGGMMGSTGNYAEGHQGHLAYWFVWWIIVILFIFIMILTIVFLIKKINDGKKRK